MGKRKPCMAITLINPREPQSAASYLWCQDDEHEDGLHLCYSGLMWLSNDLVEPTPNMIKWRTTPIRSVLKGVSSKMLG